MARQHLVESFYKDWKESKDSPLQPKKIQLEESIQFVEAEGKKLKVLEGY